MQMRELLLEELRSENSSVLPIAVSLVVVQSGYVEGGLVPTLEDCSFEDDDTCLLQLSSQTRVLRQRVFGISWERRDQRKKQSFVVLRGEEVDGRGTVWVAKVLLLLRLGQSGGGAVREYAFVQYMEVTKPVSGVDEALGCVCVRWATDEGEDWTLDIENSLRKEHVQAGEWYGLVPFRSIVSTVQVLRSNLWIRPFSPELPWPLHRFYINRFVVPADPELDAGDI